MNVTIDQILPRLLVHTELHVTCVNSLFTRSVALRLSVDIVIGTVTPSIHVSVGRVQLAAAHAGSSGEQLVCVCCGEDAVQASCYIGLPANRIWCRRPAIFRFGG